MQLRIMPAPASREAANAPPRRHHPTGRRWSRCPIRRLRPPQLSQQSVDNSVGKRWIAVPNAAKSSPRL